MNFTTESSFAMSEVPVGDAQVVKSLDVAVRRADVELIDGLCRGDDSSFERLVREHGPRMLATARRLLRCEQDSADAVQDALVSVYRNVHSFTGGSSLSTWLHRVTVNASLMRLRTRRRLEREQGLPDGLLPQFDSEGRHAQPVARWHGDNGDDACALAATGELRAYVRACIDLLPDSYRTVLLLRDIDGLDTDETAQLLGCTPGNVKTRLHRARQALRSLLEKRFSNDTVVC
jgi:RNA polymerase sigma-70 factor (ECF subfamily)